MSKIPKNRSDVEMFKGWEEPEVPSQTFATANPKKNTPAPPRESSLPESVHREMERILLEMKLDFFRRGIREISYQLKKEGDSIQIQLVPKEGK